ncbi:MAG: hypothetical protein IKK21_00320 [Clostridia bacterium]|nr:hypothetical protein [Clostridia bacterium]
MADRKEIELRVPGRQEYALVIRTALGGVAILKDLDVGTLDDLRMAADEACDCLLHQGLDVKNIDVAVSDEDTHLTVTLSALFDCGCDALRGKGQTELSQAVLETLAPEVSFETTPGGCVKSIRLRLPKAAV